MNLEEEKDEEVAKKRTHRIMVVDDEPFNLFAIKGLMRSLGIDDIDDFVDTGDDGEKAV